MKNKFLKRVMSVAMIVAAASIVFTSCKDDEPAPTPIEDGMYVIGAATAVTEYTADGLMALTRNEVLNDETTDPRATLWEKYIAVKGGADGFNVVEVTGGVATVYGAGEGFGKVAEADLDNDEPRKAFWRGAYMVDGPEFKVEADGLYHVVLDTKLKKVAIMKAEWGIIGGATENGWGGSTPLTASAFDLNEMTFSLTDLILRGGDWKFRYSDGWKVILDTVEDVGFSKKGVKVNTNFGGAVDALVPGGANIVNSDPGKYTVELKWVLGSGATTTATATKTGELPLTDWEGVVCDIVGDGVSADNANAIVPDPSGWSWGNKLLADNGGVPTKDGDKYTWMWTSVTLEATSGFKVRTENGEAPSSGKGANFDSGYGDLDVANSSTKVVDDGGNLTVSEKGVYTIKLVIDAADSDKKTITITE
jgi:hypothetical protein